MTKKLNEVIKSIKKLGEIVRKSVEDENTQTPAMEIVTNTQALRDILTLMKRSKNFFKLKEKSNGDVFWNGIFVQPPDEKEIMLKMKNTFQLLIFKFFLIIQN